MGFSAATITGLVIGSIFSFNNKIKVIFLPWFHVMQLIPGLAWIPIAMLMFGIGNTGTIFMVTIASVSPIVVLF
jgi:ABC-type nitrate/sulfonate/bicarbonate transport system permease component